MGRPRKHDFTAAPRAWLAVYAQLANLPSPLSTLPQHTQLRLMEEVRLAGFPVQFTDMTEGNREAWVAGVGDRMLDEWRALLRLHPRAYNLIHALLDGVDPPPFSREQEREWKFNRTVGTMQEQVIPNIYTGEALVEDLYRALRPDLFRRCPLCQTVFVRVRRQIYCSPICTAQGNEAKRKGDPERREDKRQIMARKRQKEKHEKKRAEASEARKTYALHHHP